MFSPEYLIIGQHMIHVSVQGGGGNKRDVEEAIFVLVLFIDAAHEGSGRGEDLIDEDEDCLLGAKLDTLANNIDELADGEICGDEVLLLIDGSNVRLLYLLADDLSKQSVITIILGSTDGGQALQECGRRTSGVCVRLLPCASRMGVRP